jgi:hypothetical protein
MQMLQALRHPCGHLRLRLHEVLEPSHDGVGLALVMVLKELAQIITSVKGKERSESSTHKTNMGLQSLTRRFQ